MAPPPDRDVGGRRRWLCRAGRSAAAAVFALTTLGAVAAAPLDLAALMRLLGQRRSGEARFTEERFVSGLDQTLLSSGVLRFRAPDRFERRTETPRPEAFIVDGDALVLERGDRRRRLALEAVPELDALVAALRGTLTGDAAVLQRHFAVAVEGDPARWSLLLTPRDSRLLGTVRELRMVGERTDLRTVELWLTGGDRSLMQIAPTRPLPAGALAAVGGAASAPPERRAP